MNTLFVSVAFGFGALLSAGAYAAAPAGAIALCKDGTYFTGTEHKGACKGHQGVKEWLDKDKAAAAATPAPAAAASDASTKSKSKKTKTTDGTGAATPAAAPTAAPAPATTPAAAPVATPKPVAPPSTATTPHKPPTPASQIAQKPGGGPGMVWVNASSKVYHCPGDEWYGKTKEGSYMTEAAAKAAGNHGDHGKECASK